MNLVRHKIFKKHFKARILSNKPLTGQKRALRAFGITGDIRVVYRIEGNTIYLYDIGTHNQVY